MLPVLASLLTTLFFNPTGGKAQEIFKASGAGQDPDMKVSGIVGQLQQNALLGLISAVVFIGIVWVCFVLKECAQLNRPQKNIRRHSTTLLILIVGLSVFCGRCTVEQRARAAEYRAAKAAENHSCPTQRHHVNYENLPFNNRYPSNGYSNWHGSFFCKYCGQRVYNSRH